MFSGQGAFATDNVPYAQRNCACGIPLKQGARKSDGKQLLACANNRMNDKTAGCGFFCWLDQVDEHFDTNMQRAKRKLEGQANGSYHGPQKVARVQADEATTEKLDQLLSLLTSVAVKLEEVRAAVTNDA